LTQKNIYFASDIHLGFPNFDESLKREKLFVHWLDSIKHTAREIYLLGDVFDFWYEYKRVVPRGFTRFLGKISEITDSGIPVHYFTGNHDIWVFDYLPKETGIILHREPLEIELLGKKFYLAHGDGLGTFDRGFQIMKAFFTNRFLQCMFSKLHPNFALWFGHAWSLRRRNSQRRPKFLGDHKEWLMLYAKTVLEKQHFDYFIFGHRHLMLDYQITENSRFIYLGDWLWNFSYSVFDGTDFKLLQYKQESGKTVP